MGHTRAGSAALSQPTLTAACRLLKAGHKRLFALQQGFQGAVLLLEQRVFRLQSLRRRAQVGRLRVLDVLGDNSPGLKAGASQAGIPTSGVLPHTSLADAKMLKAALVSRSSDRPHIGQ